LEMGGSPELFAPRTNKPFLFVLTVLGFELRALPLLCRHTTT
jgi:hypothetical protein